MTEHTLPNTDILDSDFLQEATSRPGPWVSITLPTHRTGREVLGPRAQLNNLLKLAESRLAELGHDDVDALLAPVRELTQEQAFWQRQSDGLAVFAAPGYSGTFRLPMHLPDEVAVGDAPRLRPLAPLLTASGLFYLLALSNNSVRLFEGTRESIGELDLGDVPRSVDELETDRDHQTHLQHSSQSKGGDAANFHGHGGDSKVNELATERFFRAVSEGVDRVLGRTASGPLVLATVAGNRSTFAAVSGQKQLLEEVVAGNPDGASPMELHAAAVPIVRETIQGRRTEISERFGALLGTGKSSDQPDYVAKAAAEGRVDTLILAPEATRPDGQAEIVDDPVDAILVDVLRNSGSVTVIDEPGAAGVRAIFRY